MTVTIRRACPVIIALYLALFVAGCATTKLPPEQPAMHTVSEIDDQSIKSIHDDPWVGFNRSMYKFNYNFDKYVFLPVVNTYEYIAPVPVQTGVSNFFNNLGEGRTFYNSILQGKGEKAFITLCRFVTNSTLGIGGIFDPATYFDQKRQNEDFGQTLGVWGVPTGPYLVVPVLGPGTVRSTGGFLVDAAAYSAVRNSLAIDDKMDHGQALLNTITVMKAIDNRHQQPFRYNDSGYPFEYELVKFLYRESREMQVKK
jgi:phospholipid-binding lipoprotein MlaA